MGWVVSATPRPLYPLYRRVIGPQGRSGRVRKISPSPWFDARTVQPVASRYTDWAIPDKLKYVYSLEFYILTCLLHTKHSNLYLIYINLLETDFFKC
jgi:hypothetical protein